MPVNLAPPGSKPDDRIAALERELRKVSAVADGALQVAPTQRNPTPGALIAGLVPNATIVASSQHVFGTGQTIVGPGSAGGLGGGTEKTINTVTWTAPGPKQVTFMLLAYLVGYVQVAAGPTAAGNIYYKADGATRTNMVASLLTYPTPLPADAGYGLPPIMLLDFITLAPGAHTITQTWDMFEGANDTLTSFADGFFVIQMGG
jgi:hypothetical protein